MTTQYIVLLKYPNDSIQAILNDDGKSIKVLDESAAAELVAMCVLPWQLVTLNWTNPEG